MSRPWMGRSALMGATFLCSSAGTVEAQMEVKVSGNTGFGLEAASDETLTGDEPDRGYAVYMDSEIAVRANATTDGGTRYGAEVELDVSYTDGVFIDEQSLFFSGEFGRVELGQDDGAESVMFLGGTLAQAGTGGIDGDSSNLASTDVQDSSDSTKVSYFTPRTGGLQLGISFTPDDFDDDGRDDDDDIENSIGLGANWTGEFGDLELGLSAVAITGNNEDDDEDDLADWGVGTVIDLNDLEFGVSLVRRTKIGEANIANVGLAYDFGTVNASIGYAYDNAKGERRQNVFAVAGHTEVLEGVYLNADVSYNNNDPGARIPGQDTWAGVFKVEFYY